MNRYRFRFGYESPDEWRSNERDGTDFESSNVIWVEGATEEDALDAGIKYAQAWVAQLFESAGVVGFAGWKEAGYAHWVEPDAQGSEDEPLDEA